jgi:hypothetical protein
MAGGNMARALKRAPAVSKYRSRGVRTEEGFFASQREYARWCELKLLVRAGEIYDLRRQIPMPCWVSGTEICRPVIDFAYTRDGAEVYEDVKGYIDTGSPVTRLWKMQHRLLLAVHNINVEIVT